MPKKTEKDSAENILAQVIKGMQEKKAKDMVSLDLSKIHNAVAKYFVICHASSKTQVAAINDGVEEFVFKNCGLKPFHREGTENSEWILIDYFDVVVHIFVEERRDFYKIERLWGDAKAEHHLSD